MASKPGSIEQFKALKQAIVKLEKQIFYLTGSENFFIERAISDFSKIISPDLKDFNFNLYHGNEVSVNEIVSICKSYPMMSEKRVVIVKGFSDLGKNANEKGDIKDMIPYIQKPNETTISVFIDTKPIPKNTKLGKALKSEHIHKFDFAPIPDYELESWVKQWVNFNHKIQIEDQASQLLVQRVGSNLVLLSNEIEKLISSNTSDVISYSSVQELVGVNKEFTIFELKDAIIQRDNKKANSIANSMIMKGDGAIGELLKTLGFLTSMYLNIWQYLRLQNKGVPAQSIGKELNLFGFRLNMLQKEARMYSLSNLPLIIEILFDADKAIKGFSTTSPEHVFFLTIDRLCSV